jgi:hypothetical protein
MNYYDFDTVFYMVSAGGCLLAFLLSLRFEREAGVLAFVYGAWISYFFVVMHVLIPGTFHGITAPKLFHCWWYLLNGVSQGVFFVAARSLQKAPARKPVMAVSVVACITCLVYFAASFIKTPLPGRGYFLVSAIAEALQVLSLVVFSGPVIPFFVRLWTHVGKEPPWTHHKRLMQ